MDITLGDHQEVVWTSNGYTDAAGNPAQAPGGAGALQYSTNDDTVITVTPASDNNSVTMTAQGKLGTAQVTVTDGVLSLVFNLTVVAEQATAIAGTLGTPTEKP